jgi:YVTN family beta-propeller protein
MFSSSSRAPRLVASAGLAIAALLTGACKSSTDTEPPGPPAAITIVSGNGQRGTAGTPLGAPIIVHVADANGRGVPGQMVEFTVTSGFGEIGFTPATDANGNAQALWTLGTSTTTPQRVSAKFVDPATGFPQDPGVLFSATADPKPPYQVSQASGDFQSGFELHALGAPLSARVTDSFGNPVPNVQVTFAVISGGGSVSPQTVVSDASGVASTTFTLGAFGTQQAVRASITGSAYVFTAIARREPEGQIVEVTGRPYALAVSSQNVVYVGRLDAGAVMRFNATNTTAVETINVGSVPTELAFDATGATAYVTNQGSQTVSVVNVATNTQTRTIPVTGSPFAIAVSPDGSRIYVTTNANKVYAIDPATGAVGGELATGETANGLALNADGSKLYVSTRDGGSVMELDAATMTLLRTFNAGTRTQGVLVAPDNSELYVVTEVGQLLFFNLATGALSATLDLNGNGGFGIAYSPDKTKLYVTVMGIGTVRVVDRATRAITKSWYVDGIPRRIGVTSDGTIVVANEAGYVSWLK